MQEQKKFRYVYNGKEVDREKFEELTSGSFKWFEGDSIVSVPFSAVDDFFNGEFKSKRQINDRIKSILNIDSRPIVKDSSKSTLMNVTDCKFTMCGQKNCICCYPTKNTNSTRHKSKEGETHIFKTATEQREKIELLKQYLLNQPPVQNDINKIIEIFLSGTEDELKNMISKEKIKIEGKDDVITSSNRGEKETMEGLKYNNLKPSLDIVINRQFPKALQLIALATEYGHKKYMENDFNYLNYKSVKGGSQTYFDANARHSTDRNGLDESGLPHIIHAVWSSLAGLELWAEENNIDVKEFTEKFMKNLHNSK